MLLMSRIPQIIQNFKLKNTGQLSIITTFLTFAGSLARIFTTLQEIGNDYSLLAICFTGAMTSGIILLQVQHDFILIRINSINTYIRSICLPLTKQIFMN